MNEMIYGKSAFSKEDAYLFKEGSHFRLHDKLGAHVKEFEGKKGVHFAVWAPNAEKVSVIGNFNKWKAGSHILSARSDGTGIWEGFIPGFKQGSIYKYHIESKYNGYRADKGDPFAFSWEVSPKTASVVWGLDYKWGDKKWMDNRERKNGLDKPVSVYEVHAGSWKKKDGNSLGYRELAHELAEYIKETGFTHVELMPVMEHPFYGSWGYQTGGYFAPTSRFGTPQDFMYFVDYMHKNEIGVILDWVPSHFPSDEYGLVYFDGTHLYEHADSRKGFHPDWKSYIFNYGRNEVRNFLISNAVFWLDKYHADGLRVDAVASMLYLDYSRKPGEWIPNEYGGNENIEAISFLRRLNEFVYKEFPGVQMIAEESTAWPMVSKPVYTGGLGFGMKWNMGWMNDTLSYMSSDPVFRKYNHNKLTFSILYAFTENFMLPLSHDEVVHGKGSLIGKMPGDEWQRFANLRLLFGYMFAHPGKKMIFMGGEFGQTSEWNFDNELKWELLRYHFHYGVKQWVSDLNRFYREEPAMHEIDFDNSGFTWIDCNNSDDSIISFLRKGKSGKNIVVVCNFTPVPRYDYVIGVPEEGFWKEALNSDAVEYGGSGMGNFGGINAMNVPTHGLDATMTITIPPLSVMIFSK